MGDHPGNASVTVIGVCNLGQVASLHVASVHPAVQVGTWRKPRAKVAIRLVGFSIVGFRWDSQVRHLPDEGLMPTPGGAPVSCSSQSSGPAWVEVWLSDAQARVAKWHSLTWCTSAGGL